MLETREWVRQIETMDDTTREKEEKNKEERGHLKTLRYVYNHPSLMGLLTLEEGEISISVSD